MDYSNELTEKYIHGEEKLLWSGKPFKYKDNLSRIIITYLAVVLVVASVFAWFYPDYTFTYIVGGGFVGMFAVFFWAFFQIKKQMTNKETTEDLFYAITDERILVCSDSEKKMLAEYYFAAISFAVVEQQDYECGTVFFAPNANTVYSPSKIGKFILYTYPSPQDSRLIGIKKPDKICELINKTIVDYEERAAGKNKKRKKKDENSNGEE